MQTCESFSGLMKHSNIIKNCECNIKFGLILLKFWSSVICKKTCVFGQKICLKYKKTIDIMQKILIPYLVYPKRFLHEADVRGATTFKNKRYVGAR